MNQVLPAGPPLTRRRPYWPAILLLLGLLASFTCTVFSTWLALAIRPGQISANMLAQSEADYGVWPNQNVTRFAPLNPDLVAAVATDAAILRITPQNGPATSPPETLAEAISPVPPPATAGATATAAESPATATEPAATAILPAATATSPAATATAEPTVTESPTAMPSHTPTPLPSHTAIATATATPLPTTTPTSEPSPTPVATATPPLPPTTTATATATPVPVDTNTPTHTATATATPSGTPTPTNTATATHTPTATYTPLPPDPLYPILECVVGSGTKYTAFFGYENISESIMTRPVGAENRFIPPPENRGQPTTFEVGRQRFVFSVDFGGEPLIWRLDGRTVMARRDSPGCSLVQLRATVP